MPSYFTITGNPRHRGSKPNPHGGTLQKWYVELQTDDGTEYRDCYWQNKKEELAAGQRFYGEVQDGEYGLRFKTMQEPDGGGQQQSPPAPASAPRVTQNNGNEVRDYTELGGFKDKSIAYAVGLKTATDIALAGLPDTGEKREAEIKRMARAFADDSLKYARGE